MDAGGLMAYNSFPQRTQPSSTLAVPTGGFASRGKNSHIRNISVPVPNQNDSPAVSTPRSGRALLLAGLRTAPKTPTSATSTTAFISDAATPDSSKYGVLPKSAVFPPKTARSLGFSGSPPLNHNQFTPPLPTPPASSPAIARNGETLFDHHDYAEAQAYAEVLATTNYYLAQRQQQLQQQLLIAQQTHQLQQQLAALQLQSPINGNFSTPPMSPAVGVFVQPSGQALATSPNGVYHIFNPATGTYNYYLPQQQSATSYQSTSPLSQHVSQEGEDRPQPQSPASPLTQVYQSEQSSAPPSAPTTRSLSPPKLNTNQAPDQPQAQQPAANNNTSGFRKGHRKASSLSSCVNASALDVEEPPKTSVPRLMLPATPTANTFAPGHASGCHPIRQPRGPPPLEEITAKPTTKHEGSKNFARGQRRRAVFRLITAGLERRGNRSTSGGTMTPVSENEAGFAFDDGESVASSLSGKQSLQSLREGPDSPPIYSASSMSSDEGMIGGKLVEVKQSTSGGLRTPHLVLDADKRKSALF